MITYYRLYTIRDFEGCVRYVGLSSHSLKLRASNHKSAKTPAGQFVRQEITSGRKITFVLEETFTRKSGELDLDECGEIRLAHTAEREYIAGYRQLLGDKLLNRESGRKPSPLLLFEERSSTALSNSAGKAAS